MRVPYTHHERMDGWVSLSGEKARRGDLEIVRLGVGVILALKVDLGCSSSWLLSSSVPCPAGNIDTGHTKVSRMDRCKGMVNEDNKSE